MKSSRTSGGDQGSSPKFIGGEIFADQTLTVEGNRRDYGEERKVTIGFLEDRMVVVVWTPRAGSRQIISRGKANEREQAVYAPQFS